MSSITPQDPAGTLNTGGGGTFTHQGTDERLMINKYHLARVIDRLGKRRGPRLEHVAIPSAMCLALLLALLPTDFRDYWGMKAATWESVAVILTVGTGIVAAGLLLWWFYSVVKYPSKEPEEVVDDIIDEMARDREKLNPTPTFVTPPSEPTGGSQ